MPSAKRFLSAGWPATLLAALVLAVVASTGRAQIESLTLAEMVERSEGAVFGTIVDRLVFRVDHPVDGPELYFTVLTIQGRSLENGQPLSVSITYHGGFVDDEHGVYNTEAPSEDDVRLGNRVVAFYSWLNDMGGDVAGNALYAAHGGLYRTARTRSGTVVLGRGRGYAIPENRTLDALAADVAALARR